DVRHTRLIQVEEVQVLEGPQFGKTRVGHLCRTQTEGLQLSQRDNVSQPSVCHRLPTQIKCLEPFEPAEMDQSAVRKVAATQIKGLQLWQLLLELLQARIRDMRPTQVQLAQILQGFEVRERGVGQLCGIKREDLQLIEIANGGESCVGNRLLAQMQ